MNIPKMKAPGERKDTGHIWGVIQVIVTNKCDLLRCSNCTQQLTHQKEHFSMTVDNFRAAVKSLSGYPGVVGVFGGNPTMHPDFPALCQIMREEIPNKSQRGLWSNNLNNHGEASRETFGYFNLNVHTNAKHADEMKRDVPNAKVWGVDRQSWHSPSLVAIKDVIKDEAEMWDKISKCDVNLKWSGAITQRYGKLRGYFCEIAAAFDNMYDEDNGVPIEPGWWKSDISAFEHQVKRWCVNCGIPLKMKGHLDLEFTDDVSESHLVALNVKRKTQLHVSMDQEQTGEATDYQRLRNK
jgi:hypothetical protein